MSTKRLTRAQYGYAESPAGEVVMYDDLPHWRTVGTDGMPGTGKSVLLDRGRYEFYKVQQTYSGTWMNPSGGTIEPRPEDRWIPCEETRQLPGGRTDA